MSKVSTVLTRIHWSTHLKLFAALAADYETKLIDKKVLTNKLNQLILLYEPKM